MTPYEINLLLHIYAIAEDHPDEKKRPPVYQPTIDAFISEKLIEPCPVCAPPGYPNKKYSLTARGRAYVGFVMAVPLPTMTWQLPTPNLLAGIHWPDRPDDVRHGDSPMGGK